MQNEINGTRELNHTHEQGQKWLQYISPKTSTSHKIQQCISSVKSPVLGENSRKKQNKQ